MLKLHSLITVALVFAAQLGAFYLPGLAPNDYHQDSRVDLLVNALTPISTNVQAQLKSVIPYNYYDDRFHFCKPKDNPKAQPESLGSILFGDRLFDSSFELFMLRNTSCQVLCKVDAIPVGDSKFINDRIREHYAYNWLIDGLPAARMKQDQRTKELFYSLGFELGELYGSEFNKDGGSFGETRLHNHFDIHVKYHQVDEHTFRVVGVLVWPYSKKHFENENSENQDKITCDSETPLVLSETDDNKNVYYTYSIQWEKSDIPWGTRWDNYLHVNDPKIHWFSLVNSSIIVLFLTAMVGMILMRALHKDIARYNLDDEEDSIQEDFGWKLVHGDVFRPPKYPMLLSVLIGNGVQMLCMAFATLVFAVLGFLSPSNRGALLTAIIVFYMLFGGVAGYTSARIYKLFNGERYKSNMLLTSFFFPGIIIGMFILLNFFLIGTKSSGAVPFGTLFAMFALWFLLSTPLTFLGSFVGFKKQKLKVPVRTNQIPRQIPQQSFYLRPIPAMLLGGILPFGSIFVELYFILNSIWFHKVYYVFGFLFLVFLILAVTTSQVTTLFCYFHLCAEDYRWGWRSFLTGAAPALYVLMYSVFYYHTRLGFDDSVSLILYFGWTLIMSSMVFVLTGAIGFVACFSFLRTIYGSIKVD